MSLSSSFSRGLETGDFMREIVTTVAELGGFVSLVIAGFLVSFIAGFVVMGLALLAIGWLAGR